MTALDGLNQAQHEAVEHGDGAVLIVAGPGTGKTKTLTARIAYLLEVKRVDFGEVVALTFTSKAAREMRERLTNLTGTGKKLPKITTFHALGAELLKRHGYDKRLVSEQQRANIISELGKSAGLKGVTARELSLLISRAKTSLVTRFDKPTAQLLEGYETALAERGLHDFDDLLAKTYQLLQADKLKRPDYMYILVDEFQDTNELQYELLKVLGADGNLFAIGDPKQSIYAFRGAGADMFDRFRADFPNAQEVDLTVNYRSRPEIIQLANAVFPNAPQLEVYQTEQGDVRILQTLNEYSEAAYVLGEIEKGIGGSDMLKANGHVNVREPHDYAVLYRTHRAAKAAQRAFAESGIPYQVAGEGSPYELPEVQGIIGIMRCVNDPSEQAKTTLTKLSTLKYPTLTQLNTLLVKFQNTDGLSVCDLATNIANRLWPTPTNQKAIQQFLGTLVQFGSCDKGLAAALGHIDEISEGEFYDPNINAVTLLTIHAAKGLEFSHVFLIAAEEGILPKINKAGEGNVDEEQRLFYVALTRAKESLDILHTKFRGSEQAQVSRFVAEIPQAILPHVTDPTMQTLERRAEKRRQKRAQASLF